MAPHNARTAQVVARLDGALDRPVTPSERKRAHADNLDGARSPLTRRDGGSGGGGGGGDGNDGGGDGKKSGGGGGGDNGSGNGGNGGGNGNGNGGGDNGNKGNGNNNNGNGDGSNNNNKNKDNGGGNGNNKNVDTQSSTPPSPSPTETLVLPPKSVELPAQVTSSAEPVAFIPPPSAPTLSPIAIAQSTTTLTAVDVKTMTMWIPMTTTIDIFSSQPRKGVDQDFPPPNTSHPALEIITTPFSTSTSTETAVRASATVGPSDRDKDKDNDRKDNKKNKDDDNRGGLDQTAEHLLIAAGAIGAFILFCFVGWIVYRTMKKSRDRRGSSYDGGFLGLLPWRKDRRTESWGNQGYPPGDLPPYNEKGDRNSMQNAGFYGAEKMYLPPIGGLSRSNTGASQRSMLPQGVAPGSVVMVPVEQYAAMSANQSLAGGSDMTSTLRSRMPDAFFNQSELARQPSDAYDPARRQVYRASDLSSLSSGFGDGDLIIVDNVAKPPPASVQLKQSNNFVGRFSWMSRKGGQRETVYTTTSEDRPAKFRTIGSWVNQQAGRVRRAEERNEGDDTIPPMPNTPGRMDGPSSR